MTEKKYKILRGYYLTGVGQEEDANYFKMDDQHSDYEFIAEGDICLTFYQNQDVITSIPALIRVDHIIKSDNVVSSLLKAEKNDHLPMLPIVQIFDSFNPKLQKKMQNTFQVLNSQIKELSQFKMIQGNLFDFLEEEGGGHGER